LYTVSELSKKVNRNESVIRELIRDGKLKIQSTKPYMIKGSDWSEYANKKIERVLPQKLKDRVTDMRIRNIDEKNLLIQHSNILDVWESGIKDVYIFKFEDGYSLKCTKEHLVFTDNDWVKIGDIEIDSDVKVCVNKSIGDNIPTPISLSEEELKTEKWVVCKQDMNYSVSSLGRVSNNNNMRILSNGSRKRPVVNMNYGEKGKIQKTHSLHTLVLTNFVSDRPENNECCHKDGNYYNNRLSNLYWGTANDNLNDKYKHNSISKLRLKFIKLISVDYVGKEMTYDLSVAGEYKNFVANGIVVHNSVNEYSGRYSIMKNEFYLPETDRMQKQSATNKQGSGEQFDLETSTNIQSLLKEEQDLLGQNYDSYIDQGLARELARINLPLSTYTEWYWKIDLHNLFHFIRLRADSHAQQEIVEYANAICELIKDIVPNSYEAFEDYRINSMNLSGMEKDLLGFILKGGDIYSEDFDFKDFRLTKREFQEFEVKYKNLIK
jgi:hypothetical protein